jgi:hypothetical protein
VHNILFLEAGVWELRSGQPPLRIHMPVCGACGGGMHSAAEGAAFTAGPQTITG